MPLNVELVYGCGFVQRFIAAKAIHTCSLLMLTFPIQSLHAVVMQMAKATGIKTVPFALIKMNEQFAYITRRVDRIKQKDDVKMLAMESSGKTAFTGNIS